MAGLFIVFIVHQVNLGDFYTLMNLPLSERQSLRFILSFFAEVSWTKRSKKHEEKFANLTKLPREKLIRIGTFYVRFDQEFMIGKGRDGTRVYVGLSDDGNEVAVKRMLTHTCEDLAENEKRILNMMKMEKSPHIVRYRYCTTDDSNTFTYLVLELCEGTLDDYVASLKQEELDLSAPRLIREILTGLLTLHGTGKVVKILHKDLNPWNILVDVEGHMRLADFGVSRTLNQDDSSTYSSGGNKEARYWRAVESVHVEERDNGKVIYKRKSDIQVVGMLVYYILTKGGHPFGDEYNRVKNLIEGNPVDLDKLSDPSAKDLVSWMLQHEIEDRPYVEEALTHPYVQPRRQFSMLVCFGNEPEIKDKDTNCDVVNQLNEDSSLKSVDWISNVDPAVLNYIYDNSKYKDNSITSLVRFIRNAWEDWRDKKTPEDVRKKLEDPEEYFLTRFPILPVAVHKVIRRNRDWRKRPRLKEFFKLSN